MKCNCLSKTALINNKNNNTYLQNPSSKKTIYIGELFDLDTSRGGWNSAGIIPAVQMAFEEINNSSKVLKDYRLELLIKGNSSILMMQVTEILYAKKLTQQEQQTHFKISTWKRELKSACKSMKPDRLEETTYNCIRTKGLTAIPFESRQIS